MTIRGSFSSWRNPPPKRASLTVRETIQLILGSVLLLSYRGAHENISAANRFLLITPTDDPAYTSDAMVRSSNNTDHGSTIDVDSICLVHIGKTAGSFVSCRLGLTYASGCNTSMSIDSSSVLADKTNQYLHLYENSCHHRANRSAFLVTVRNPIDRIISWWEYEKPKRVKGGPRMKRKRLLWLDCYDNIEDMASKGLRPLAFNDTSNDVIPAAVDQMTCQQRAWAAALGERKFGDHNYYNYAYYKKEMDLLQSSSNSPLLVLRSEHLEDDWNHIEKLISGNNTTQTGSRIQSQDIGNKHNETKQRMQSNQSMQNLCAALCEEIQVYKQFLRKAINLSPVEVTTSMKQLRRTCPQESQNAMCRPTPMIPSEKSKKRSYPKAVSK